MKIRHSIIVDHYGKLLEHLRYSGSILLSWNQGSGTIKADCEFLGTKKGFEQAIKRGRSFSNVKFFDVIGNEIEEK